MLFPQHTEKQLGSKNCGMVKLYGKTQLLLISLFDEKLQVVKEFCTDFKKRKLNVLSHKSKVMVCEKRESKVTLQCYI